MALQLPRGTLKPQKTIPAVLDGVHIPPSNPKPVTVHLKPASRANEGYFNAQAATPDVRDEGGAVATANASDLRLAKIYCNHVIDHWDDVLDGDGNPVPYTPELGLELFTWLITEEKRPDKFRGCVLLATTLSLFEARGHDPADVGKR